MKANLTLFPKAEGSFKIVESAHTIRCLPAYIIRGQEVLNKGVIVCLILL